MIDVKRGIKRFAVAFIIYGIFNLLSFTNYSEFKLICAGLPEAVVFLMFAFGVIYSVLCIKCGLSMIKLEEWARKTSVILVFISLVLGLLMTPFMMKNLPNVYAGRPEFSGIDTGAVIKSAAFFTLIFTAFEIIFVYYFTRSGVKETFKGIRHERKSQ